LLGSFALLLAVVVASVATPMLAVEEIRVTGLHSIEKKKVLKAVADQQGVPLALVSQDHIAESLAQFSRIESFSLISELPHTLHISIKERSPIAIVVVGGVGYLYDPAGIKLDVAKHSDLYPLISAKGDPSKSTSYRQAIDVLLALPADLLPKVASVNATSKDNVMLQLRGYAGQKIIWGDSSQSILKSRTLAALIANQKQTDRVTYDVSSPSAPVVRWR
jgi:cell division protein FtsQ